MHPRLLIITTVQRLISVSKFVFCSHRRYTGTKGPREFALGARTLVHSAIVLTIQSVDGFFRAAIFLCCAR